MVWEDGDLRTEVEEILEEESEERDPLHRGARVGKYEIEDLIDTGGSSSVYKAFEPGANRYVALKLLHRPADSDFGVRFRREVEVQANLKHPNLMPIFDQGDVDGKPYYTMELLHKPATLETVVSLFQAGRLGYNPYLRTLNSTEALLRHVVLPVARAVEFANVSHGIIHRDLKPENVIVDARTLRVYVIDFGICHVIKKTGGRLILRAGTIESGIKEGEDKPFAMGTLRYMPPEQAKGGVSPQGDVWALGAAVHFILTNDAPISRALDLRRVNLDKRIANLKKIAESCRESGDQDEAAFYEARAVELQQGEVRTLRDVLRDAQEGAYVPLPEDTDPILKAIVLKAMAVEPENRYSTAGDFANDVQSYLEGRPARAYTLTLSRSSAALYSTRLFLKRNRAPVIAASMVLLVLGVIFGVNALASSSQTDQQVADLMRRVKREHDPSRQVDLLNHILRMRADHTEAEYLLAAARTFGTLLPKIEDARAVRDRMMTLIQALDSATAARDRAIARRRLELIETQAAETAALLEKGVLPDLKRLPPEYPVHESIEEVTDLASALRGRRVVHLEDFPAGAEVRLVRPADARGFALAWDQAEALGKVPLARTDFHLDPGSYVFLFRRPEHEREVSVPVRVTRAAPARITLRCPLDPDRLPPGMMWVSGVEEMQYGDPRFRDRPVRVTLESYLIDRTETSNAKYAAFLHTLDPREARLRVPRIASKLPGGDPIPLWTQIERSGWRFSEGAGNHPVTGISLHDAMAYAAFAGKRLPTAPEWEHAARGVDSRDYPFGSTLDPTACNTDSGSVAPTGTYPRDRSPFGVLDLAGNVAEWTDDPARSGDALVKGGSYDLPRFRAISTSFLEQPADRTFSDVGFRCAMSATEIEK
ncbi:MAG: bifunctional serine/threonine-protein kinase/formylglycine-generating enzyme family protein [Planctomycetota bacterium]